MQVCEAALLLLLLFLFLFRHASIFCAFQHLSLQRHLPIPHYVPVTFSFHQVCLPNCSTVQSSTLNHDEVDETIHSLKNQQLLQTS